MKAVVCNEFGPPEKLSVEEVPDPAPAAGQVLVEMLAAAIVFPDTLVIEDRYQFKAKPPFVVGGEVAGVVLEVGDGVEGFAVGDEVVGGGQTGGFAEKVAIPADQLRKLPIPGGFAESTGLGYAYGTGQYGLKHRGDLRAGESLLVTGASGSVGLAAIELGKLHGARVIAAASSAEKLALCEQAGADALIDYSREDLKQRAKELSDGGVDVVYDAVGGERAEQALRALAWRGRFLVIGFTAGIPSIPLNLTLLKGCDIRGVFWGASRMQEPEIFAAVAREIDAFASEGKIKPQVTRRYPLDEVPRGLREMMDRQVIGKVVAVP
ncbi:MAG: NADPH:quinone oxidoreductase family protein [Acidobacteria bacterium]|nr:MAG: NADPH:quinone oxidoreductase family protein [Acidobacteriota bacterium]